MDRNITNSPFRYWVTEVREKDPENGSVLMFGTPFGDDLEYVEWDAPAGNLLAISDVNRVVLPLHLSPAHVPGRGSVVGVEGWNEAIQPPFLLTDLEDVRVIANQEVKLSMSERAVKAFDREYLPFAFPVQTKEWFGLLIPQEDGGIHLVAFSALPNVKVKNGDAPEFSEWEKPCGVLSIR